MGNETSSARPDLEPDGNGGPSDHVSATASSAETNATAPIAATSKTSSSSSTRFSTLFRSQNVGAATTNKGPQQQYHLDAYDNPQTDQTGVMQQNKIKPHEIRPAQLNQRHPFVDGDHSTQRLHAPMQVSNSNGFIHPYTQSPQRPPLTGAGDPHSGDITKNMMHMSLNHTGEKLSHHHLSGGVLGPPVPVTSTLKHNKNLSSGSLGPDLDAWENAWEEDDESSEGDDGIDDHDVQLSSKSLPGLHAAIMPMSHNQKISPTTDIPDMIAKVSITPSHNEIKGQEMSEAMNGIAWDTYTSGLSMEGTYDKPSVQMFLPMLRVLGKGSFGKVVLVQRNKSGGLYAMKILKKTHLIKKRQIERTKTERKVLSVVDHPFIMKLHYAFQSDDRLYLVLDYCAGGELFFHLSRLRRFPERVAKFYTAELLLALGYLHNKGIIYRDLKPENVLLDAEGHVKLGDFGLAKDRISHPYKGATSVCGTPEYMAPEILQQWGHGFCVDYWGLGMLTYEMMTGLPPWYTTDREKLFRRLKSAPLDIPPFFLPPAVSFVSGLLERDPRRRLGVKGVKSVIAHDFFRGLDFRDLLERRIDPPIRPCEGWKLPDSDKSSSDFSSVPVSTAINGTSHTDSQLPSKELDAATQNFDQSFTRMPVDSVAGQDESNLSGDLTENTDILNSFLGFTYDERKKTEDDYDDQTLDHT